MLRSQDEVITAGHGQGFGILTSDTIVVPRCTFKYENRDQPMAYLDVFSFKVVPMVKWMKHPPPPDPNEDSDWTIKIDRVATFELPKIRSAPELPTDRPRVYPGSLAIECVCNIDPSFSPSPLPASPAYSAILSNASEHHSACVFEVSEDERVLRFKLDLPTRFGSENDGLDLDSCSWLLVPAYVFSSFIRRAKLEASPDGPAGVPTFAWHEWGWLGRWVHNHKLSDFSWMVVTSGTRTLLLHRSTHCPGGALCDLCEGIRAEPESPKIWILDFSRRKLQQYEAASQARGPAAVDTGTYQPASVDACTPKSDWLDNAHYAVAPYMKTLFWHELVGQLIGGERSEVWIDDEHVLLLDVSVVSRAWCVLFNTPSPTAGWSPAQRNHFLNCYSSTVINHDKNTFLLSAPSLIPTQATHTFLRPTRHMKQQLL
ncbi:hypothetical protein FRC10_006205 [Ceratobasidium sp. 414]|nr:hypothetical protein FRC10_006205 [Ceratobasidium sp. 414]